MRIARFYWRYLQLFWMVKVAAVIRVAVRRSVVPVEVRETVVRAIVPIATKADRANNVGIDEVRVAPSIPYHRVKIV